MSLRAAWPSCTRRVGFGRAWACSWPVGGRVKWAPRCRGPRSNAAACGCVASSAQAQDGADQESPQHERPLHVGRVGLAAWAHGGGGPHSARHVQARARVQEAAGAGGERARVHCRAAGEARREQTSMQKCTRRAAHAHMRTHFLRMANTAPLALCVRARRVAAGRSAASCARARTESASGSRRRRTCATWRRAWRR